VAVVELDMDFQGIAVVAFCLLEASLLMGDIAELVVGSGGFVSVVEVDFDLKSRAVVGFCLLKESLPLSEARANQHQRLAALQAGEEPTKARLCRERGRRGRPPPEGRALDEVSRASLRGPGGWLAPHDGAGGLNDRDPRIAPGPSASRLPTGGLTDRAV